MFQELARVSLSSDEDLVLDTGSFSFDFPYAGCERVDDLITEETISE